MLWGDKSLKVGASEFRIRNVIFAVLAIIFLISLLVPWPTLAARETARRLACASNMRRIVSAMESYHGSHGSLPAGVSINGGSALYPLLPFLESKSMGEALSSVMLGETALLVDTISAEYLGLMEASSLPFVCSSDATGPRNGYRMTTSDHVCSGDRAEQPAEGGDGGDVGENKPASVPRGTFGRMRWTQFDEITDGLANTATMTEVRIGAPRSERHDKLDFSEFNGLFADWGATPTSGIPRDCAANMVLASRQGSLRGTLGGVLGARWIGGRMVHTRFLTILPPNSPSCVQLDKTANGSTGGVSQLPIVSASSYHPGGVNVGLADGSVRFVADDIDCGDLTRNAVGPSADGSDFGIWGEIGTMNTHVCFP